MSPKSISLLILLCTFFQLNFISAPPTNQTINAVIGDVSFVDRFGRAPDSDDSESLRITTHLHYVASLLAATDVSHLNKSQLENRKKVLTLLEIYTQENPFPKNYEYLNERRPTFIDKHGSICAVGYLVQQTVGDEVAQAINSVYKYGFVMEMESELLDEWLNEYGLTKKEAAMIQPAYGPSKIVENDLRTDYIVSSSALTAMQIFATSYSFSAKNSPKTSMYYATLSAGLASSSIILGIYNLNRSERTESQCCFSELTISNESKRNLSIANIALGSASILFNTYRAFQLKKETKVKRFVFTPSSEFVPGLNETVPTANLLIRF